MTPETVTLDEALQLLSLPRVVGTDAEEREIVASPGRFGPYLKRADGETRSLTAEEQLFTITLAEAEALYAQPKQRRGRQQKPPIAELGDEPRQRRGRARARRPVRPVRHRRHRERDRAARTRSRRAHARRSGRPVARPGRGRPAKAQEGAKKTAKKATKKAAKKPAKKAAKKAAKKTGEEAPRRSRRTPPTRLRSSAEPRLARTRERPQRRSSRRIPITSPIPPEAVGGLPRSGIPAALRARRSCRASATGSGFVAILALASKVSANAVGFVMVARMLPGLLLAPVGGALVDRWNRKAVMVTCDIGRAGLLVAAAVLGQPARPRRHLVLDRGAHVAVGPGEGRDGSQPREGSRPARVGELARARSPRSARSRWAR